MKTSLQSITKVCYITLLFLFNNLILANLDTLALKHGTDKSSLGHNYTKIYETYFNALQNKCIKFLEIGFAGGPSARMWDTYFTNPYSRLYFIDINPDCFKHMKDLSSRCSLNLVDQGSEESLKEWSECVGGGFDIIIDDGGHQMNQQIISFKTLFPLLKKGGIYIIEDLHTSYWNAYGSEGNPENPKAAPNSAIRFIQSLVDDLNFVGARSQLANRDKFVPLLENLSFYQEHIAAIHFYTSIVFIFKD